MWKRHIRNSEINHMCSLPNEEALSSGDVAPGSQWECSMCKRVWEKMSNGWKLIDGAPLGQTNQEWNRP